MKIAPSDFTTHCRTITKALAEATGYSHAICGRIVNTRRTPEHVQTLASLAVQDTDATQTRSALLAYLRTRGHNDKLIAVLQRVDQEPDDTDRCSQCNKSTDMLYAFYPRTADLCASCFLIDVLAAGYQLKDAPTFSFRTYRTSGQGTRKRVHRHETFAYFAGFAQLTAPANVKEQVT